MSWPDVKDWELACEDERRYFKRMDVYTVVPCPENRKVMRSKWVFQIKQGLTGETEKHKVYVVGKGFTQVKGLNYNKTFALNVKFALLCTILAIAAKLNLKVHQMDVKSAYLNGKLCEEISWKHHKALISLRRWSYTSSRLSMALNREAKCGTRKSGDTLSNGIQSHWGRPRCLYPPRGRWWSPLFYCLICRWYHYCS